MKGSLMLPDYQATCKATYQPDTLPDGDGLRPDVPSQCGRRVGLSSEPFFVHVCDLVANV